MKRKLIALLLCLALAFSLCACGSGSQKKITGPSVTDAAGRQLAIPEDPSAIRIASVYGTAVPFIVALQLSEQVTAINCKSNFWTKADEALGRAGTVGRGVVDLEALAASGATVLVHRANDAETVKAVDKLGIDTLCIQAEDMDEIYATLLLMAEYFGKQERAQEVVGWMEGKFAKIDSIVAQIPESERHTALVMGGELGRIAGGDMIQSWMIEKAGGICVAADTENDARWLDVGVETVFGWDPEYIFCTSSAALDYTVDEVLEDSAWSAMKAVKNGHIAQIPSKLDTWDMPGIAAVLSVFWMLHEMYPEHFDLEELEAEIDEYYEFMFGKTFDPDYLGYELDD